eukprot:TRINITY_DN2098_c0_g1_i1.p1 TRINITY_DN2098_c0_g1~~TRINITY_DN2098_c0_g1_i1.p1  ORF type:complete len:425 (-),score=101.72 TRINITY_DN2098_c0_g1_i1:64-1338(-)
MEDKKDDFIGAVPLEERIRLAESVPLHSIKKQKKKPKIIDTANGSGKGVGNDAVSQLISTRTISLYPHLRGSSSREGGPIRDSYKAMMVGEDCMIAVICDGCEWGTQYVEASRQAAQDFSDFVVSHLHEASTTRDVVHVLLRGLSHAHWRLSEGKAELTDAGTTALLGGVLIKTADSSLGERWAWISVTIGNSISFHSSEGLVRNITSGNLKEGQSPRDCGRLGPVIDGLPDTRDLNVGFQLCEENDMVLLLSDGVHINLSPEFLGVPPTECGYKGESSESDLDGSPVTWSDISPAESFSMRMEYMQNLLGKFIGTVGDALENRKKTFVHLDNADIDALAHALMKHCLNTTSKAREWMEMNPNSKEKLPRDFAQFSGRMDHASAVILRVGKLQVDGTKSPDSSKAMKRSLLPKEPTTNNMSHLD